MLVSGWPVISLLASDFQYTTYINLLYLITVFIVSINIAGRSKGFWTSFGSSAKLFVLYITLFLITTYYGVDHAYSLKLRYYLLPVGLVYALIFFTAGYYFQEISFLRTFSTVIGVYLCLVVLFLLSGLKDFSQTRIISGVDVPMALSASLALSRILLVPLFVVGVMISLKISVLLCSLAAVAVMLIGNGRQKQKLNAPLGLRKWHAIVLLTLLVLTVAIKSENPLSPYVSSMVGRIFYDRTEDVYRLAAFGEFIRLVKEHFPIGTGYYTFGSLTSETLPYSTLNADGSYLSGMSLHNTPMHVVLEGGLPLLIVYLALYRKALSQIRDLRKLAGNVIIQRLLLSWIVIGFLYGLFNQFHSQVYYFGTFAYISGVHARYTILNSI